MNKPGMLTKIGTVAGALAIATTGAVLAPDSASAHTTGGSRSRSCGTYDFVSGHNSNFYGTASTSERDSSSCAGHSWVRVMRWNGSLIDWKHADGYIEISVTSGSGMQWSEHKTQSNESARRFSH